MRRQNINNRVQLERKKEIQVKEEIEEKKKTWSLIEYLIFFLNFWLNKNS